MLCRCSYCLNLPLSTGVSCWVNRGGTIPVCIFYWFCGRSCHTFHIQHPVHTKFWQWYCQNFSLPGHFLAVRIYMYPQQPWVHWPQLHNYCMYFYLAKKSLKYWNFNLLQIKLWRDYTCYHKILRRFPCFQNYKRLLNFLYWQVCCCLAKPIHCTVHAKLAED